MRFVVLAEDWGLTRAVADCLPNTATANSICEQKHVRQKFNTMGIKKYIVYTYKATGQLI